MDPEDPYSDPDHFQNSAISSFYLFRHILKISSKSVHKFFSYNVHKHICNLDPDDPDSDPDHSPNLITCSSHHLGHLLKMSSQSIHNFLRYLSYYISRIQKIHIVIRITSKIQPFHLFTFSDISWKFHQNPFISFWAILYTNTSGSLDPDDPDSDPDHSQNLITCSSSQ